MAEQGDLRVWHIPQIPMKAFKWPVSSVEEGCMVIDILCHYDLFQYENNIKPDYANMSGISRFEDDDWYDMDEDEIAEIMEARSEQNS